ncbi:density-regulated protein homolog [Limulus polyphemus]|uniref:Density-regulated protein homolog n=1 Tax=Limulus polyphemus TaxID=6850 RepID=A0ABM1SZI6_LIMPO|nr:density-regulated protein homolog [Limulus polyphemus]
MWTQFSQHGLVHIKSMASEIEAPNSTEAEHNGFPIGPQPGVSYPLKVLYCGECTMPLEWLVDQQGAGEEEKKRQKRGGKGMVKTKKKTEKEKRICLSRAPRGKKKSVTVVSGLKTFDIDLKDAAKFFAHKFSCGSSVTGEDELVIQGDVKDDLFDIITEKWPEIDDDFIEDLGNQSR